MEGREERVGGREERVGGRRGWEERRKWEGGREERVGGELQQSHTSHQHTEHDGKVEEE